jgi:TonB-linked SusC/RagA family outer membrane protein
MKKTEIISIGESRYPKWIKILRIMKISIVLFIASVVNIYANTIYSQKAEISLDFRDAMVKDILVNIEDQSEFYFLYSPRLINDTRRVSIQADKEKIGNVLNKLFAGTNTDYVIKDRQIVISTKSQISSFVPPGRQGFRVTGQVTDAKGETLPGVNIVEVGTNNGVATDFDGKYEIFVAGTTSRLHFSYVGFLPQEIDVNDNKVINMVLEEDAQALEEVVVVGYATQKKINMTGSVDVIKSGTIESRPVASVEQALQGASPNLNITVSGNGGEPGSSMNWNIRGLGTLSGSNAPLVLVDGVQMDVNSLDPESIESVSVLKDAAASAIYGARAPFGVVLITTKHGKKGGGFSVSLNSNVGFASAINLPQFAKSIDVAHVFNQAAANSGSGPLFDDESLTRIQNYLDGKTKAEYDYSNPYDNLNTGIWEGNANHNWVEEFFKKNSMRQKYNLNMTGGTEKTSYYLSTGFYDQGGIYNYGDDTFQRFNVLANVNSRVNDWFGINFSTKLSKSKTDYPIGMWGKDRHNIYFELMKTLPMTPEYAEDGHLILAPGVNQRGAGRESNNGIDLLMTLGVTLEPVKGWVTNISYNYDYVNNSYEWFSKEVLVATPAGNIENLGPDITQFKREQSNSNYNLFNATSSYEKQLGNHYFKAMLGYEQELYDYVGLYGDKYNLLSSDVPSISTATGDYNVDDWKGHSGTQGIFGRFNYNYKEKYLFEFNARYNGSSKFAQDNRWGFFPSASVGYVISKEDFWNQEGMVNLFKLRASYGSLGNQNVDNYLYLSTIPIRSQLEWIMGSSRPLYAGAPDLISPTLTWETITTLNLGIDLGFFKNRLGVTFDYFTRETTDMFGPARSLPSVLGTNPPLENNAEMMTKGWETAVTWRSKIGSDGHYNLRVILGDNHTEITKYRNDSYYLDNWYEGQQVGEIWGYETDGFIQQEGEDMPDQSYIWGGHWGPGDIKYKDLNGDGEINEGAYTLEDHGDLKVIGNSSPRYNYGFSFGADWKGIDFNMFWQGVGKRDLYIPKYSSWNRAVFYGITGEKSHSAVYEQHLDYWRPADDTVLGPNTDAYYPKPYFTNEHNKNLQTQSKYLLNAAYLRLKNIQLGYTISQNYTKKVHIEKLRFYISGENLYTITKLTKLLDPETSVSSRGSGLIYPLQNVYSFGVNLTF